MKIFSVSILIFIFVSCANPGAPVEVKSTGSDFQVVKLFEIDGVTIYRFVDGYTRYFATGKGTMLNTNQTRTISNGKTSTTEWWQDGIETVQNNH